MTWVVVTVAVVLDVIVWELIRIVRARRDDAEHRRALHALGPAARRSFYPSGVPFCRCRRCLDGRR